MKRLLYLIALMSGTLISGCTTAPIVMDNGFQRKVITQCNNDVFCFRKTYDITWDSSYHSGCSRHITNCGAWDDYNSNGYPVSYRSKEFVYANDPYGYAVTLPEGGNVAIPQNEFRGGPHE